MKTRDASGAESGFALGQPSDGVSEMWGGVGLSAVLVLARGLGGFKLDMLSKSLQKCWYRISALTDKRERGKEREREGGGERERGGYGYIEIYI